MKIISRKKAKALGLKRYFTGKPCKRGHVAERLVSKRDCCECAKIMVIRWRKANSDYWRAWLRANPEKNAIASRTWAKANPEKRAAWESNRKAKKKGNGGLYTAADIADLYRLQRGHCAACGEDLKKKYHVDHIVPVSLGGSNDRSNLQLLHPRCNLRKKDKHPLTFYRELGLLL